MLPIRRLSLCVLVSLSLGAALLAWPQAPPGAGGTQGARVGTTVKPGEACPPGTTMVRPGNCRAPEFPPPSIVDYRPRSTLVTAAHLIPKARYPVIDFHGHPQGRLASAETVAGLMADLDALNVRLMVSADNSSGDRLRHTLDVVRSTPSADRVRILAGINLRNVGSGWAETAVAQLEADIKAGAVGVGEISKSFGMSVRKADGTRLAIDDPALDPVWDACARLNIPVFIHTADPQEFYEPIDEQNERWLELSLFAERRYPADRFPRFEDLMAERDRLFARHPKTRFVAAHLAWRGNDLARLGGMLDAMPNVYTEVGAVLYDLGRQPRAARDFLVKYQDRVLFGKDAFEPSEYPYYWRVFETRDEYFDYYRDYHAFWKLYGLDLPDAVLKKLYYQNALRITPGLPQAGWPK